MGKDNRDRMGREHVTNEGIVNYGGEMTVTNSVVGRGATRIVIVRPSDAPADATPRTR